MSVKKLVNNQYKSLMNKAISSLGTGFSPPEGWICTLRKSLGMSLTDLGDRVGKSRMNISKIEKAEIEGRVVLKTLQDIAKAIDCQFVYGFIPNKSIEETLEKQALYKAQQYVSITNIHMKLEEQGLPEEQLDFEIQRLKEEYLRDMPSDFWKD